MPAQLYDNCSYASETEVTALLGGPAASSAAAGSSTDSGAVVDRWLFENLGLAIDKVGTVFGCCNATQCDGASPCTLRQMPQPAWVGGYWDTWGGKMSAAGHLANTLMLQLVNNGSVTGGVSAEELPELYAIAERGWWTYKNPINAQRFGGDLAATFAVELAAAAGVIAPTSGRAAQFQYYFAHDVNVAFMQDFLSVEPQSAGWPAGASSIFLGALTLELHGSSAAATGTGSGRPYTVRCVQHAASPSSMRSLDLTGLAPTAVLLTFCSTPDACPIDEFLQKLLARIVRRDCLAPSLAALLTLIEAELLPSTPAAPEAANYWHLVWVIACATSFVAPTLVVAGVLLSREVRRSADGSLALTSIAGNV